MLSLAIMVWLVVAVLLSVLVGAAFSEITSITDSDPLRYTMRIRGR